MEGPELYLSAEAVEVADKLISLGEQIGDKERMFAGHDHRLQLPLGPYGSCGRGR